MTTEEKFNAAVNVIRNLPKNGSYQPSHDLMLRFYGLFKQANVGPCEGSRPPFWDPVGRAKYDAHKRLGNMPKQEAMKCYVDELHQIVETMSYSDTVASFLQAPTDEMDLVNMEDLELIAGDVLNRVRSQHNSPLVSREASPSRSNTSVRSSLDNVDSSDTELSDEEFIDSVESPDLARNSVNVPVSSDKNVLSNGPITNIRTLPNGPCIDNKMKVRNKTLSSIDVSTEILGAVESLRSDIERLKNKVNVLENSVRVTPLSVAKRTDFINLSPQLLAFILLWPFVASLILQRFVSRK